MSRSRQSNSWVVPVLPLSVLLALLGTSTLLAGPDVIVAELEGDLNTLDLFANHGKINQQDTVAAYSIGTTSCNIGDAGLNWSFSFGGVHPVIGTQAYRLKDGRFEQIGLAWVKHGFLALNEDHCNPGGCAQYGQAGSILYPGCSDPYGATLNGDQNRLGPRSQVNASTGVFQFPFSTIFTTGNALYKRMQIADADLNPALNPGATYYVEGQYITQDDFANGTQENNVSYRQFNVEPINPPGTYRLRVINSTVRLLPAVYAWADQDPTVEITTVIVPNDGKYFLGCKVTDLGDDLWSYEYFLYNEYSHRSCGSVVFPFGNDIMVQSTGFHDVHYHSGDGEPFGTNYSGTDWTVTTNPNNLTFATTPYTEQNKNANAIRWGTGYNFRFVVNAPPVAGNITIGMYRPGTPTSVQIAAKIPGNGIIPGLVLGDMNANTVVDLPDVPLFVDLLLDPVGATADAQLRGDMNEDIVNDAIDLPLFVEALLGTP